MIFLANLLWFSIFSPEESTIILENIMNIKPYKILVKTVQLYSLIGTLFLYYFFTQSCYVTNLFIYIYIYIYIYI